MTTEVEKAEQMITTLLEKQKAANLRAVELFDESGRLAMEMALIEEHLDFARRQATAHRAA
jgi:hypothetical protein